MSTGADALGSCRYMAPDTCRGCSPQEPDTIQASLVKGLSLSRSRPDSSRNRSLSMRRVLSRTDLAKGLSIDARKAG